MKRRDFLAAAAGAGLAAGAWPIAARANAAAAQRVVSGAVTGDGKPLAGVLVSDGCRVARTDAQGAYRLPTGADSGHFVFVTTPRGFWSEQYYRPLAGLPQDTRVDFPLRSLEQPDRFDFVFITDMHVECNRRFSLPKTQASLREIAALSPRPAFLWGQGDISLQEDMGKDYLACLALAKMPFRNGPGNHDILVAQTNPREPYQRLFGPTYYSFDWGPIHCVMMDGNRVMSNVQRMGCIHGGVGESELAWLAADLAAQPEGKPIIAGIHIPLVSSFPERHTRMNIPPFSRIVNNAKIIDLFARHRVRLVLQGHAHENERQTIRGVEYVTSGALAGSWFRGGEGMERNVDGVPRGYRVVSVDGSKITHRYRTSSESRVERQGEFVNLPRNVSAGDKIEVLFNCYDAPNEATAQLRLDQGPIQPMPSFIPLNAEGLGQPHHFRQTLRTDGLSRGRHTIEVRVRWPDGTEVVERAGFEV